MAKDKKSAAMKGISQENKKQGKGRGIVSVIITLLSVLLIFLVIFGGAYYLVIHNNINGLAERYRPTLQGIPVLKLALPAVKDPLDPKYLTADEIKQKYTEFRALNKEQEVKIAELQKKLDELKKSKSEYESYMTQKESDEKALKDRTAALDERQAKLDELKKQLDEMIANGDKASFGKYFESVDPAVAKEVYAEVVKQQQVDENAKKFAQIYETMEPASSAQIFEAMGTKQMDLITQTLKNIKKEVSSEIIAAMSADFAAKVTEKLDQLYKTQ